jgi:hypothetical protein
VQAKLVDHFVAEGEQDHLKSDEHSAPAKKVIAKNTASAPRNDLVEGILGWLFAFRNKEDLLGNNLLPTTALDGCTRIEASAARHHVSLPRSTTQGSILVKIFL